MRHKIIEHWKKFFEQNYITEDDQIDIDWGVALYEDLFESQLKETGLDLEARTAGRNKWHKEYLKLKSQLKEEREGTKNISDYCVDRITSIQNQIHVDRYEEGLKEAFKIILNKLSLNNE